HGDRIARSPGARPREVLSGHLDFVSHCRQLHRRGHLRRRLRPPAELRVRGDERYLGHGNHHPRDSVPQHRRFVLPPLASPPPRPVASTPPGTRTAGGVYTDSSNHTQAWVADETSGTWGSAIEAPGFGTLNSGGTGRIVSLACGSAGDCSGGGFYTDGSG